MDKYTTLRLPVAVADDLKVWKAAFEMTYAKDMTYSDVIQRLTACVEKGDTPVNDMYTTIIAKRKEQQENKEI